jgi:type IV pilus assembly protein PilA
MKHLRAKSNGFTLIELLVVVLILAILMAVAMPLYLSAVSDSQRKTCRTNMQTIANAVQAARVAGNLADYSTLESTNVGTDIANYPNLTAVPVCPTSGTYSITVVAGGYKVTCTNHGDFQPGKDAN